MKANTLILALLGVILVVAMASVKRQEEPFANVESVGFIVPMVLLGIVVVIAIVLMLMK
jgi:hypothetical protein